MSRKVLSAASEALSVLGTLVAARIATHWSVTTPKYVLLVGFLTLKTQHLH